MVSSTMDFMELIQRLPRDAPRLVGFIYLYQQPNGEELLRQVYSSSGFHEAMSQLRSAGIDPANVNLGRVQVPIRVRWRALKLNE